MNRAVLYCKEHRALSTRCTTAVVLDLNLSQRAEQACRTRLVRARIAPDLYRGSMAKSKPEGQLLYSTLDAADALHCVHGRALPFRAGACRKSAAADLFLYRVES